MVLLIVGAVVLVVAALVGIYCYNNMHHDDALMAKTWKAGFVEKSAVLPDGSAISYGEGPDNGPALLLIHGQTIAWEDYDTVLPQLSTKFHVFAVDCYGHGQSTHDPALYTCDTNGKALAWFMDNVIGKPCYVSGLSSGGILTAWLAANAPEKVQGIVLEDPPLFRVTPEQVQEGKGAFTWVEGYQITHSFVTQDQEKDFTIYSIEHSYMYSLFGGLKDTIVQSARSYRQQHPREPLKIFWLPPALTRVYLYFDDYDPRFGDAFYNGSWMTGINQEAMLKSICCPTVYLKANTVMGKDGILYAANTDADADRVQATIPNCKRINIKSGHDIHVDHPDVFVSACEQLLQQ